MSHRFSQLDVFASGPLTGNPLAVVHGADDLSDAQQAAFARWTGLSETTFLLAPKDPGADYRVRIRTPHRELPFAGHPTLGSCRAWLAAGGRPKRPDRIVQECGIGLVTVRLSGERLAFAAPQRRRTGPLDAPSLERACAALRLPASAVVDHQWVDNGPGWAALRLASAKAVLAIEPDGAALGGLMLGVVGPHPPGAEAQFEVRALIGEGSGYEDPVTGSLNASLGQWLIETGVAPKAYVAAQGARLGAAGRVWIEQRDGEVWVGGRCDLRIEGTADL